MGDMDTLITIIAIVSLFRRESTHVETDLDGENESILISDMLTIPSTLCASLEKMGALVSNDRSSVWIPHSVWR